MPVNTVKHKVSPARKRCNSFSIQSSNNPYIDVYVTGLPPDITVKALRNLFMKCGAVTRAKLLPVKENEFSTKAGFVSYSEIAEAECSVEEFNGCRLGRNSIKVKFSQSKRVFENSFSDDSSYRELLNKLEQGPLSDADAAALVKKDSKDHSGKTRDNMQHNKTLLNNGQLGEKGRTGSETHITDYFSADDCSRYPSNRSNSRPPRQKNFGNHSRIPKYPTDNADTNDMRCHITDKFANDIKSFKTESKVSVAVLEAPCKVCGKLTQTFCSLCSLVHYCTQACQIKDWSEHSKVCKKPNDKLIESVNCGMTGAVIESVEGSNNFQRLHKKKQTFSDLQRMKPNSQTSKYFIKQISSKIKVGNELDILVTDLDPENAVLICQVADQEQIESLSKLQVNLNEQYSKDCKKLELPMIGDICAAKFAEDGQWYRAVIEEINNNKNQAQILFVDYGNHEVVDTCSLMWLDKQFCEQPAYSLMCKLANSELVRWSEKHLQDLGKVLQESGMLLEAKCTKVTAKYLFAILSAQGKKINDVIAPTECKSANEITLDKQIQLKSSSSPTQGSICNNVVNACDINSAVTNGGFTVKPYHISDMAVNKLPPGQFDCFISFVLSPSKFYCQLVHDDLQKLQDLQQSLTDFMTSCTPVTQFNPCSGDVCAAVLKEDGNWYRAEILRPLSNKFFEVYYCDFGNTENIALDQIQPLPEQFISLSVQAFPARLADCFPKNGRMWCKKATEYLKTLVMTPLTAKLSAGSGNTTSVTSLIVNLDCNETLNSRLVLQDFAVESYSAIEKQKPKLPKQDHSLSDFPKGNSKPLKPTNVSCTINSMKDKNPAKPRDESKLKKKGALSAFVPPLNEKLKIGITCSNTKGVFHCQVINNHLDTLCESISDLTLYAIKAPRVFSDKSAVHSGICCAAYCEIEQTWYRATVVSTERNTVRIKSVDYGNYEQLPLKEIIALPNEFRKLPTLALPCVLANMRPINLEWSEEFNKAVDDCAGKELDALFLGLDKNENYLIQIPYLVNTMIKKEIAQFCL